MEVDNQFTNCSHLSIHRVKIVNLISVVFSAASFLLLLLFLAFLVLYRAYGTTLQRLFLYLTIATALNAMVDMFSIELQFDVDDKSKFCAWIGFGDKWTSNTIELFNFCFTVYLITIAYQKIRGRQLHCLGGCRRHPVLTEVLCTLVIIFLPLSYLWVPAYHRTYGLGDTVCGIKRFDKNCEEVKYHKLDSTILESVSLSLHMIVIFSFLTLIVILSVLLFKLRKSREESLTLSTVGRALFLMFMIGISTCIRVSQLGVNISIHFFSITVNHYFYDAIDNSAYTLSSVMTPLGFAVYLYSPRKLRIRSLKRAVKKWMCRCCYDCYSKRQELASPHTIDEDGVGSVKTSIVRNDPSHTTPISTPYTNEFTAITEVTSHTPNSHTPNSQGRSNYGSIDT